MTEGAAILEELAAGRTVISYTKGDSMQPLLYEGKTYVVLKGAGKGLKRGDLPLYRRPDGKLVMHRIIRVKGENYYTRGDNRCGLEEVPSSWVVGVVTEIMRKGKAVKVTDCNYKSYVRFWNFIYPLRWFCYKLRALTKKSKKES